MNSEERRRARFERRQEKRAENRRRRIEGATIEDVADLDALYKAAMKARSGVAWKASVQRYCIRALLNVTEARSLLLEGGDFRRGFH